MKKRKREKERKREREKKKKKRKRAKKRKREKENVKKFEKTSQDLKNPPDELSHHDSKKKKPPKGIIRHFFFESSESHRVSNQLADSNSIFGLPGINLETILGRTVRRLFTQAPPSPSEFALIWATCS